MQVLVVDDEADARELVAAILSTSGATVTVAISTAEALAMFDQVQPDVLISDIGMPDESGYVLIQQLRAREATQNRKTPAIALTAYAQDEDRRQVLGAGFQGHLAKPVDPATLVSAIQQLLQ